MDRRSFLGLLGGAITAVAAKPVLALVPAPAPVVALGPGIYVRELAWWETCNVIAFSIHSEAFPEHRVHYRQRALAIMVKVRQASR